MKKKRSTTVIITLAALLMTISGFAVPACPDSFETEQSDGTKIRLRKRGDEFLKWHEDSDGFSVVRDEKSKDWFYAELSADASKLRVMGKIRKECGVRAA